MPATAQLRMAPTAPLIHLSRDFIRAKEYFEAIVASTSDAICTTDTEGRIIYFSPGSESMLGARMTDVIGSFAHQFYAEGRQDARNIMKLLRRNGSIKNHELVLKTTEGRHIHASMSVSVLKDRAGRVIGTMGISKDISSHVELEKRLRELSNTDNLTGLYNQRSFHDRLSQEASRARRQRYRLSMILLDLDCFKQANDQWGHLAGDQILKDFAGAVEQSIRKEVDSAYRYGGDEFVVLLPGLAQARAEKVARRISSAAGAKTLKHSVGCSYGVATLPPSGSLKDFVRQADRRMFLMKSAKRRGAASSSSAVMRAIACAPSLRVPHRV